MSCDRLSSKYDQKKLTKMGLGDIKSILLRNRYFIQLRYSSFFIKLFAFLRPAWKKELQEQKKYYLKFFNHLKPGQHTSFDIGANEGFVTGFFLQFGFSVIAVEPDQRNIAILIRRFRTNGRFQLYSGAAGQSNGTGKIYLQKNGTAFSTLSSKWKELIELGSYRFHSPYGPQPETVKMITLDELIETCGMPSYIKIDVEGYEAEVIKGLNKKVPILLFEANLPQFMNETLDCLKKLNQIDENAIFNYSYSFTIESEGFSRYDEFIKILPAISHPCIDIICIMSNYFDYYTGLPIIKSELSFE